MSDLTLKQQAFFSSPIFLLLSLSLRLSQNDFEIFSCHICFQEILKVVTHIKKKKIMTCNCMVLQEH